MNLVPPPPDPLRDIWSDEPEPTPSMNGMFVIAAVLYGAFSAIAGWALRVLWEMWR